mmetsp:Transcript_24637/g.44614  ORF Transcript_24637/g.44614 Transcript_24637/m.44614 type:complete len:155 (-) Transcript_24637:34-498(-)
MARLAMALSLAALAVMLLPTVFVTPPSAGRIQHEKLLKPSASAAQEVELNMSNSNPVGAVLAAAMVGLLAGLITGPQVARAQLSFANIFGKQETKMETAAPAVDQAKLDREGQQESQKVKEELSKSGGGLSKKERLLREQKMKAELAATTTFPK